VVTWQETVCAAAREWEGTPYVPKGRVKGVGVDCGGFLYEVYNPICGPFLSMPDDYSADWSVHAENERYINFIREYVNEIEEPEVGGFSLYHMGLNYAHAAILLENGRYIHAWGRLRSGRVTQTPIRVMNGMAKLMGNGFPVKHFTPKPELIRV
jgi:cell wall-associated NlpC family hydrolase